MEKIKIVTNKNVRVERIKNAIQNVINACKESAAKGAEKCCVEIDVDIYRDVIDELDAKTNIRVVRQMSRYAPTRSMIDVWGDTASVTFDWF